MDFVITKSKWARAGVNKGMSALRNENGNKCCLGFVCNQLGLSPGQILRRATPAELFYDVDNIKEQSSIYDKVKFLVKRTKNKFYKRNDPLYQEYNFDDSGFTQKAIDINDDEETTDEQKMKKLTSLFEKYGHTITFK